MQEKESTFNGGTRLYQTQQKECRYNTEENVVYSILNSSLKESLNTFLPFLRQFISFLSWTKV